MPTNQLSLLSKSDVKYAKNWSHGGSLRLNKRKVKRPLIPGKSTHVIFKSSLANGSKSLKAHQCFISKLIMRLSRKYFVRVQRYVNVGNHIHFKVKFKDVGCFQNFMRVFAALTARHIMKAKKSHPTGKFWDHLVFTRVLTSRFEELVLHGYFSANVHEVEFGQDAREQKLEEWRGFYKRKRGG